MDDHPCDFVAHQRRLERLAEQQKQLCEESRALRSCLEAVGVLSNETFLAEVHKLRFQRVLREHPCSWSGSLELALQAPGLSLQVAGLVGHGEAIALSECSVLLRNCIHSVSIDLADLFPPATFLIGGVDDDGDVVSSVERFDVTSGTWSSQAQLNVARWACTAAVLSGRIFVMGGRSAEGEVLASVEVFDFRRCRWESAPLLHEPRADAASASARGSLIIAGGLGADGSPLQSAEQMSAEMPGWSQVPSPRLRRRAAAAVSLRSAVFVIGGWNDTLDEPLGEVEFLDVLDLASGTSWIPAPPLCEARAGLAVSAALDSIYAIGGCRGGVQDLSSIERFTPGSAAWETVAHLEVPRRAHCAASCGASILVMGGVFGEEAIDVATMSKYDLKRNEWQQVEGGRFRMSRRYFAAAACRPSAAGTNAHGAEIKCTIS